MKLKQLLLLNILLIFFGFDYSVAQSSCSELLEEAISTSRMENGIVLRSESFDERLRRRSHDEYRQRERAQRDQENRERRDILDRRNPPSTAIIIQRHRSDEAIREIRRKEDGFNRRNRNTIDSFTRRIRFAHSAENVGQSVAFVVSYLNDSTPEMIAIRFEDEMEKLASEYNFLDSELEQFSMATSDLFTNLEIRRRRDQADRERRQRDRELDRTIREIRRQQDRFSPPTEIIHDYRRRNDHIMEISRRETEQEIQEIRRIHDEGRSRTHPQFSPATQSNNLGYESLN